jgi:hypothetical protein
LTIGDGKKGEEVKAIIDITDIAFEGKDET